MRPFAAVVAAVLLAGSASGAEPADGSLSEGFVFEDASGELRFDVDGRFAADWVQYDPRNARDPQARLDRALLGFSTRWRDVAELRVAFDTVGIDTRFGLWELWASVQKDRLARLSIGLLPLPLGVEHSWREGGRPLVGLPGFAAFLTGRTDFAAQLDGELIDGLFSYDVSASLGEGFDGFGQRRGDPQFAGRATAYPFRPVDWEIELGPYVFPLLSGLFASFAYTWTPDYDAHLDLANPLRNKLFHTGRLQAGESRFWHAGFGIDLGPVRAVHEIVRGSLYDLRTPAGPRVDLEDQISAWQIVVSWRITGEPYDSRPFRQRHLRRPTPPRRPLDGTGSQAGFGALEVAFRYANADIDREFFDLGFTSFTTGGCRCGTTPQSSQEFRTVSVALHWDPTAYLRVSGEVVRTIADQFPAVFDSHGRDTSWLVRAQYSF